MNACTPRQPLPLAASVLCCTILTAAYAQEITQETTQEIGEKAGGKIGEETPVDASQMRLAGEAKPKSSFAAHHKLEVDGLLMLDFASVGGIYSNESSDSGRDNEGIVRRARIGISGDFNNWFDGAITLDLDGDDSTVEVQEAVLGVRTSNFSKFRLGLHKQPFGLENSTGSRRLRTMERSIASRAFAPDRGVGLSWSATPSRHYIGFGAFADEDIDNAYDISGRAAYAPVDHKKAVMHFGINASYRENDGNEYRIRYSGVSPDGNNFVKSGKYDTEHITTWGVEAAWQTHSFSVQTEWFQQWLDLAANEDSITPKFSGGYVQFGYVLHEGRRKYSKGTFGKIAGNKSNHPIELVAAIGQLDTIFADKGDKVQEMVIGLNYHWSANIKIAGQFQNLSITNDINEKDSGNSILLRLQVALKAKAGG